MGVHFDIERMEKVRETHDKWWRGELDRPLAKVVLYDRYPAERRSAAPALSQATCADFQWSPEAVIDSIDENLSRHEFLGDSFPMVDFAAFGPGVLAAFCGARLDTSSGRVWFFADREREIGDIHVRYDPQNRYVQRVKALYRAGLRKWNGAVLMGMPDLGGVMDVAATFRGTENLLTDLYDEPEEVLRLCGEIQEAWYAAYADLSEALLAQKAHTNWSGLASGEPMYILQSDFCYMIGNPMFRRFVYPTLMEDTRRLPNTIYHLDGIGELTHLDDILGLEKLKAVQWVYGDGQPGPMHWLDVYRRIQRAGKRIMLGGGAREYLDVIRELHGSPYISLGLPAGERDLAERVLSAR